MKHTHVCAAYERTGECPNRSTCRFHHPTRLGAEGGAAGGGSEGDFAARLARARRAMLEAALDDE